MVRRFTRTRKRRKAQKFTQGVVPVQIVKAKRRKSRGPKLGALLKPKLMVKLGYADIIELNVASGGISTHVMRTSSIFDPDLTGVGHQPLLHDQYALLYSLYRVVSSKIKVTPVQESLTGQIPGLYGVFADFDSALDYGSAQALIEDKTRTKQWSMITGAGIFPQFKNVNRILKASFNAKRKLGKEGANEVTAFGSNPSNEASWEYHIWAASINANDPGTFQFVVEMEYTVELSDPIVVTQS